jgi:hypothetical protein
MSMKQVAAMRRKKRRRFGKHLRYVGGFGEKSAGNSIMYLRRILGYKAGPGA